MSEERLQEIKDSVSFQKEILLAHNMDTLCTDEEEELIEEIERLNKVLDELEKLCKTKYYEKNTTDIDSIAIAGNLYVYMYKKIKELKGNDKE